MALQPVEKGEKSMIYLQLFCSFFKIGLLSFGGGYAAMPLIQNEVVEARHWLTMPEFTDLITISQMTPGPIALNSPTFVGFRLAGIPGALVATLGCVLPSCIIVTCIAKLYLKYQKLTVIQGILGSLRPAVVGMIAAAGISILSSAFWGSAGPVLLARTDWVMAGIFAGGFLLLQKFRWNPILVMVLAGGARVAAGAVMGEL